MAAVTVTKDVRSVFGNKQVVNAKLTIANTNTWNTRLHVIESFHATSPTNNAIGGAAVAGVITFATGGTETGALVEVIGL